MEAEEGEEEDGDGLGEMGGEGVEAEDAEAEGVEPVGEGGFFEIADAVDVEGDEVSGEGHVAGGVGVGGVGVVEQGRGEERGEEDDEPEAAEDEQSGGALGAVCGYGSYAFDEWLGGGLIDHNFRFYQHKLLRTVAGAGVSKDDLKAKCAAGCILLVVMIFVSEVMVQRCLRLPRSILGPIHAG